MSPEKQYLALTFILPKAFRAALKDVGFVAFRSGIILGIPVRLLLLANFRQMAGFLLTAVEQQSKFRITVRVLVFAFPAKGTHQPWTDQDSVAVLFVGAVRFPSCLGLAPPCCRCRFKRTLLLTTCDGKQ